MGIFRFDDRGQIVGFEEKPDEARLAASRETLLAARDDRIRPGRDDKVLADWNGLAIAALCRAAAVFARPDWIALAENAFAFIVTHMAASDGRIQHAWRLRRVAAAGLLEDQAAMARAALALYETTGTATYLDRARGITDAADTWFGDRGGSYFSTAEDATDVPLGPEARPRTPGDNATPSGNGVIAQVLARLHHLTGGPRFRDRAEAVIRAYGGLGDSFSAAPGLLVATDMLEEMAGVVVTGPADHPLTRALLAAALAAPDPAVCVLRAPPGTALEAGHPAFGKTSPQPAAYVCRNGTCGLPIHDAATLAIALRSRRARAIG